MNSRLMILRLAFKDLSAVFGMVVGYIPSLVIPGRFDNWLVDRLASLLFQLRPGKTQAFARRMSMSFGDRTPERDLLDEAQGHYKLLLEGPLARLRSLRRNGWKPDITVEGMEHLEAGRAAGAGTVLWRMPFGSSLATKTGLYQEGVSITHLSEEYHGASSPVWISRKLLCPLIQRSENWFVSERVIIPDDGSTMGIMKTLLDRLKNQNAVVSLVAYRLGTQNLWAPLFDGWAGFAIGSPSLAWRAGSVLLPVYTAREGTGRYKVVIDEPIEVDRSLKRKDFLREATDEYAARMEKALLRYPGSWGKWGRFWSRTGPYETQTTNRPATP